jgi:glycine cleavage system H protein
MTNIPNNLKYTEEHEWALKDSNNITIGITDFAQSSLGDIVFVELPETGTLLKKMEPFGVVESIKSVSDLFSPITGKVIEKNQSIIDNPELINSDPYGSWFLKISPAKEEEYDKLLSPEAYQNICQVN